MNAFELLTYIRLLEKKLEKLEIEQAKKDIKTMTCKKKHNIIKKKLYKKNTICLKGF